MPTRSRSVMIGALVAAVLALGACGSAQTVGGGSVDVTPAAGGEGVPASATVPTGFPSAVPQPQGFTVDVGARSLLDGKANFTVIYRGDGDQSDAISTYVEDLKSTGFTLNSQVSGSDGNPANGVWRLSSTHWVLGLASRFENGTTTLVLNLTAKKPASS